MSEQHTPGPWRIGKFLDCCEYEHMTFEWKREQREREAKQIFANFHNADRGKSRIHIATVSDFDSIANAELIAQAPDLLRQRDALLEACKDAQTTIEKYVGVLDAIPEDLLGVSDGTEDTPPYPYTLEYRDYACRSRNKLSQTIADCEADNEGSK